MSGDSVHLHHPLHYRAGLAWLGFRLKSLFDIGSFFQSPVIGSGLVRYHCVWHEVLYLRGPEGGSLYRRWPKDEVSLFKKKDTPELA